jgi:hypothetical protein
MRAVCLSLLIAAAVLGLAQPAQAILQFNKQFTELYIKNHPDQEFAKYVNKEVKCWACHQGKKRIHHNPYGIHLVELLDKKQDIKNPEKIIAALKKVGDMPSDPDDPNSKTYAELIAESQLPGGSLEDCQKEPPQPTGGAQ